MGGVPLMVLARNLGHATFAPCYVADAIRAGAPRFGTVAPSNVRAIGR